MEFITTEKSKLSISGYEELTKEMRIEDWPTFRLLECAANATLGELAKGGSIGDPKIEWKWTNKKFKEKQTQWIYFFTVNGFIFKIGQTRAGLEGRMSSYSAGAAATNRESGTASTTNYVVMQNLINYVKNGATLQLFAFYVEKPIVNVRDIRGNPWTIDAHTIHHYEKQSLDLYKSIMGHLPLQSKNGSSADKKNSDKRGIINSKKSNTDLLDF